MASGKRRLTVPDDPLAGSLDKLIAADSRLQSDVARELARQSWDDERALLLALINQVPDYLFVKDIRSRYLLANRSVAADLGIARPEELIGKSDFEVHVQDVAQHFYDDDQEVMRTGCPKLDIEEFMVDAGGAKKWLSTSKVPLRNERNEIIGLIGVARDVTGRKQAEEQVQFLAFHDTLTGLPNRAMFEIRLSHALAAPRPKGEGVALLYLDLDRFKHVNDTLGHPAGDELIRQVAVRLEALIRERDTVARLGGDEFAVIQVDVKGAKEAEGLSQRILDDIGRPFELFGDPAFIGASIGIAVSGGGAVASSEMLKKADIALYEAKARGRNRHQIFSRDMAEAVLDKQLLEQDLRKALATATGLKLVYQPIFSASAGTILGAEALLRWEHPIRGVLSPEIFMGIAEERGLIDELGEWVLGEVADFAASSSLPWIAVNVSPVQLQGKRFAEVLLDILGKGRLCPTRLQLEITEGTLLKNADAAEAIFRPLREKGIRIALDDFGTAYSSMKYLRLHRLDKLKIDRSFVQQLGVSEDAEAIVRAIVSMARAMQMKVTAEGVETTKQRDFLAAIDCDELQGLLLSRPLEGSQINAMFAAMPRR
jgi:diguanylate cyclase (GGDEF)-like protein/PAS domain S-box-containing protein